MARLWMTPLIRPFATLMLLAAALFMATPSPAADPDPFSGLKDRLVKDGFDREGVDALYAEPHASFDHKNLSLFFGHREYKLDYGQFTTPASIKSARAYARRNAKTLKAAEKDLGVPPGAVTAILLVETRLGKVLGNTRVFNVLSSMAALADPGVRDEFYGHIRDIPGVTREGLDKWADRKSGWAYAETAALIRFCRREKTDPLSVKGSYAGAFGIAQFMPTSVLAYARDGDGDGKVNLFTHADAIFSVANYLKTFGWSPDADRSAKYRAVHRYNPSKYYVNTVLAIADALSGDKGATAQPKENS